MSKRQPFIFSVMGTNGTGKSTFASKIIQKSKQRTLIVTQSGMPEIWRGYKEVRLDKGGLATSKDRVNQVFAMRYYKGKYTYVCQLIHKHFRDGLVLFDDCRGYIGDNVDHTLGLRDLLMDFRHLGLDIGFIVHAPDDLPPRVWSHTKYCFVGKTTLMGRDRQKKISNPELFLDVQMKINKEYLIRKNRKNNGHYGLFKRVEV